MKDDILKIVAGEHVDASAATAMKKVLHEHTQNLGALYQCPVITLTLNIMGPVKTFPLALKTFEEGIRLTENQLAAWKVPLLFKKTLHVSGQYAALWAARCEALTLKEILCLLEDSLPLGRLLNLDVIGTEGRRLTRGELGFPPRRCLVCSREGSLCAAEKTHPTKELLKQACALMTTYFEDQYALRLSSLSMQALLFEVSTTPKPGLVDRNNNGSHRDMDIFTFEASAVSLNQYFEKFVLCGIRNADEPMGRIFSRLRSIGVQAESAMFKATAGVNTHKGLIFALAIFNCALGFLYAKKIPYSPQTLTDLCSRLVADVLEDFEGVTVENAKTNGERLYALYGIRGARGQALDGYALVTQTALPALKRYLKEGFSLNDAGCLTLLEIIAASEDTNIIARSSYERMRAIRALIRDQLNEPDFLKKDPIGWILSLDRDFIKENLSPGGSADLLALTFFLYLYEQPSDTA